jgi:hypothetical protein
MEKVFTGDVHINRQHRCAVLFLPVGYLHFQNACLFSHIAVLYHSLQFGKEAVDDGGRMREFLRSLQESHVPQHVPIIAHCYIQDQEQDHSPHENCYIWMHFGNIYISKCGKNGKISISKSWN